MDLQEAFYLTAIVFFVLSILILLAIGIVLFYIKKKISELHDTIDKKIDELYTTAARPVKAAAEIGSSLLSTITTPRKSKRK